MSNIKFYSKLIFYSLVGRYYRKYMEKLEFFRVKGSSTWHSQRHELDTDNLSFKDKVNLNRLAFGEKLRKEGVYGQKTRINYTYYYYYYLCDIALGDLRQNGLQWISGMNHDKIKKLRKVTDYSLNTYGKDNYKNE